MLALALLAFSGCQTREPEPVVSSSVPEPAVSETAPHLPTTDEAARHNKAIKPANVHIIQFDEPEEGDPVAVLTTTAGDIKIRLFPKQVPKTVEEFTRLVEVGHYNGQIFGVVVPGYKIEQTSPAGNAKFPEDGEFSLDLWNFSGAVSLANNGSDFIIVDAKQCLNPQSELEELNFPRAVIDRYLEVGGAPHQDWTNTVFGQVIEGMDIVDKIAGGKAGGDGKPVDPVVITEARIEPFAAQEKAQSGS